MVRVEVASSARGQVHQPAARLQQGRDAVYEGEVAEVVGAELRLEAIGRAAERACHDARIGDDHVKGSPISQERIGAGSDARQRG